MPPRRRQFCFLVDEFSSCENKEKIISGEISIEIIFKIPVANQISKLSFSLVNLIYSTLFLHLALTQSRGRRPRATTMSHAMHPHRLNNCFADV